MMNSVLSKILVALLSLILIFYVAYQAVVRFYNPHETVIVKDGDFNYEIDLDGFFVREENVITSETSGVISYNYKNSQKVAKDAIVANIYNQENDLYHLKKIDDLKKQKLILEQASNKEMLAGAKLDLLNKQILISKLDVVKKVDDNDLLSLDSTFDELMLNMNKLEVCLDKNINFDETIQLIDEQIASLQALIPVKSSAVKTTKSGYFSNMTDGYENTFTTNILNDLSIAQIEDYMNNQKKNSAEGIGKILPESNWYFVSLVSIKEAESFFAGQTINLKFNSKSTREIPATVEKIITEKDNKKAAIILKGGYLDENLVTMRFEHPSAIIGRYSGIIIPKEAIRVVDGLKDKDGKLRGPVKGVYILMGKNTSFKEVNVLYEDDYILISKQNTSSNYVTVYDQVIIKGKALNGTSN